ncbi:MAG: hypothetical protein ABI614_22505, partial [Planctomycetota bacterium]
TEFDREDARIATAEVTELSDVECWAQLAQQDKAAPVEEGAQAVLIDSANIQLQRRVAVVIDDAQLGKEVKKSIQEHGQGFVVLRGDEGSVDFQVAVNDMGEYELWDRAGAAIPNLRPSLLVNDPQALKCLVGRLVHISKYRSVQELDVPDRAMQQKLLVELAHVGKAKKDEGTPVFHPGDKVKLTITNTQSPGRTDDPALILNVCVLDLQSDWSISQVYPAGAGLFEPLDPGQTISPEFEADLPEGYKEGVDVLKVFATRATTSFRWLELPALDQPPAKRFVTRGLVADPLEQLLAQITDTTAGTRSLRLTSAPSASGWTVAQVELRVER